MVSRYAMPRTPSSDDGPSPLSRGRRSREGQFALASHDDIGTVLQVFRRVAGWLRSTQHDAGTRVPGHPRHLDHRASGQEVAVEADHPGLVARQSLAERCHRREGAVEHADAEPLRLEIGGQVEQPERGVRPHHLPLLRVISKIESVREEKVHGSTTASGRGGATRRHAARSGTRRRRGRSASAPAPAAGPAAPCAAPSRCADRT